MNGIMEQSVTNRRRGFPQRFFQQSASFVLALLISTQALGPVFVYAAPTGVFGKFAGSNDTRPPGLVSLDNSINSTGSYTYSYDFELPPSRRELMLPLSLGYDSQRQSNGVFGIGWESNLPYIQRLNKTGTDKLYSSNLFTSSFDSELVAISDATYVPRIENGAFHQYHFENNVWTVTDKQGVVYVFGQTAAARQDNVTNPAQVYTWMLEEIRDTNDNVVRYTYTKDSGQIYPRSINYTGHDSQIGNISVYFERQARSDQSHSYASGFLVQTNYRISEVRVEVDSSWVKKYTINYTTGDQSTLSLISAIQETGRSETGDTITLPSTLFSYSTATPGWELSSWSVPFPFTEGQNHDSGARIVDFNGDGLPDSICAKDVNSGGLCDDEYVYFKLNTGFGFSFTQDWTLPYRQDRPQLRETIQDEDDNDRAIRFVDVNGDGFPDLLRGDGLRKYTYISNGTSTWQHNGNWNLPVPFMNQGLDVGLRMGDINGDGLIDIVCSNDVSNEHCNSSNHWRVFLNNGNGWTEVSQTWTFPTIAFVNEEYKDQGVRLVDLNHDGLSDIAYGKDPIERAYLNTGNGWATTSASMYQIPVSFVEYDRDPGTRLVDFNGDGYFDVVCHNERANGLCDKSNPMLRINQGYSWLNSEALEWLPPEIMLDADLFDRGVRLFDLNGDGLTDVVYGGGTKKAWLNKTKLQTNLLTGITLPTGGTIDVAYTPSTQLRDASRHLTNPHLPTTMNLVTGVTTTSGYGDTETVTYDYEGGEYYFGGYLDRQFAGFAKITETDATGITTEHYFHQGNDTNVVQGETVDTRQKIGKRYRVDVRDATKRLYQSTVTTWEQEALGNGAYFVMPQQEVVLTYDGDNDHVDRAVTYTYDATTGNLLTLIEWGAVLANSDGTFVDIENDRRTTTMTYAVDESGRVVGKVAVETLVDQAGNTVTETRHYYDNRPLGEVDVGNQTKREQWVVGSSYAVDTYGYDTYGQVIAHRDPRNNETTYSYDPQHLFVATETSPLGQTTSYTYDYSSGNVRTVTDPAGVTTATEYDPLDRVLARKVPDSTGGTLVTHTTYDYTDTRGEVAVRTTVYRSADDATASYSYYDGRGRLVQTREQTETPGMYRVSDTQYDARGLMAVKSLPYFKTGAALTPATTDTRLQTTYTYDPLRRTRAVTTAVGTTVTTYDQGTESVTDPLGNKKDYAYDAFERLVKVVEYNGGDAYITTYDWTAADQLASISDALGNVRQLTYDGLNRRLSLEDVHDITDSVFGTWRFTYDTAGNRISQIDPNGQEIQYTYDAHNRVMTEDAVSQSGTEVIYNYDTCTYGIGRLCSVARDTVVTAYTYYPDGTIASETKTIDGHDYVAQYAYDRLGNKTSIEYPDGSVVTYVYNDENAIESVMQRENNSADRPIIVNRSYGPTGQVTRDERGNGTVTTTDFDPDEVYRLRSITTIATTTFGIGGPGEYLRQFELAALQSGRQVHGRGREVLSDSTTMVQEPNEQIMGETALLPALDAPGVEPIEADEIVVTPVVVTLTEPSTESMNAEWVGEESTPVADVVNELSTVVEVGSVFEREETVVPSVAESTVAAEKAPDVDITPNVPAATAYTFTPAAQKIPYGGWLSNTNTSHAPTYTLSVAKNGAMTYDDREGFITFTPQSLSWDSKSPLTATPVAPQRVAAGAFALDDVFAPGVSVALAGNEAGIRKDVVIESLAALGDIPPQARHLEITFAVDTNLRIPLGVHRGKVALGENSTLLTPEVWDASQPDWSSVLEQNGDIESDPRRNQEDITWKFTKTKDGYEFTKIIPVEWLLGATYPVTTDVDIAYGPQNTFDTGTVSGVRVVSLAADSFVVCWTDGANSTSEGKCKVGALGGETMSFGATSQFASDITSYSGYNMNVCKVADNKIAVVYADDTSTDEGYIRVGEVSGTSIDNWGVPVRLSGTYDLENFACTGLGENVVAVSYNNEGTSNEANSIICTIAGTTAMCGSEDDWSSVDYYPLYTDTTALGSNSFMSCATGYDTATAVCVAATVANTTISYGPVTTIDAALMSPAYVTVTSPAAGLAVVGVGDEYARDASLYAVTTSGTTLSVGSASQISNHRNTILRVEAHDSTHVAAVWSEGEGISNYSEANFANQTMTPGTSDSFAAAGVAYNDIGLDAAYLGNDQMVICYSDAYDSADGKCQLGALPATGGGDNTAPTAPSTLLTEGMYNPSDLAVTAPVMSAVYHDPDTADTALAYQVQVADIADYTTLLWDSGKTVMDPLMVGETTSAIVYAGEALVPGLTYYWRIKFWDGADAEGEWSRQAATFSLAEPSGTLSVTDSFESVTDGSTDLSSTALWKQAIISTDDGDWQAETNATPSANTGPTDGSDGTVFIYTEASSGQSCDGAAGKECVIEADIPDGANGTITFDYHMYGSANVGTLDLDGYDGTTWTNLWQRSGTQGNQWNTGNASWSAADGYTHLRFRVHGQTGWQADIALDNISVITDTTDHEPPLPPTLPIFRESIQNLIYTYDPVGNILAISDESDTDTAATTVYAYDDLYRVVEASTQAASTTPYARTYAYNAIGNITHKSDQGDYVYQGLTGQNYANPHAVTAIGAVNYVYDANGNLLSTTDGVNNIWSYRNELITTERGGLTAMYMYDHEGRRVLKDTNSIVTYYPFPFYEVTAAGDVTKYIMADEVLVAIVEDDTPAPKVYHVHTDHLNSTNVVTGDAGYMHELVTYYPFGQTRIDDQFSDTNTSKKFTGHNYDSESDLTYMKARYYDGQIGKFTSQDPASLENPAQFIMDPQLFNTYGYARNNPLKYNDPTGEVPVLAPALGALAVQALRAMAVGAAFGVVEQGASDAITTAVTGEVHVSSGGEYFDSAAVGGATLGVGKYAGPAKGAATFIGGTYISNVNQGSEAPLTETAIDTALMFTGAKYTEGLVKVPGRDVSTFSERFYTGSHARELIRNTSIETGVSTGGRAISAGAGVYIDSSGAVQYTSDGFGTSQSTPQRAEERDKNR